MANHGSKYTDRKLIPVAKNQNPSSEGPDRRGLETGGRDCWSCPTAKASPAVWHALRGVRNHPRFEASSAWISCLSYHREDCAPRRRVCASAQGRKKGGRHKVPLTRPPQVARASPPRVHPFSYNQTDHYLT